MQKTVFITGAASGIGRAAAKKFAKEGYFVGAYDVNTDGLKTLKGDVGENLIYGFLDVTDEKNTTEAIAEFEKVTGGKLDVLVSNAGVLVQKPFDEASIKEYRRMCDINSYGMVNIIYQTLPMLKQTKGASIVITSSSSAVFGMPNFAVYSATKGFLKNLTEALSTEFKKYDIKVSDVMPLFVKSGMTEKQSEQRFKDASTQTPEQIAKVIFKAATSSNKRHHLVGGSLKFLAILVRLLPTRLTQEILKGYLKVK